MKVISINQMPNGSTGKIMFKISSLARQSGMEAKVAYPKVLHNSENSDDNIILLGTRRSHSFDKTMAYYTSFLGFFSFFYTAKLYLRLKKEKPDIIHIHNLHGEYINLPLLFHYFKHNKVKVIWTLHDCCSFTGQCSHFSRVKCDKWKTGCYDCPKYNEYPRTKNDNTKLMWKLKKKMFTNVPDMTIVTPSEWLADYVKQSFLKDYDIKVINNGIDIDIFKPTSSSFRQNYGIGEDQIILLGVANAWVFQKGIDVFTKFSKELDSEIYKIVLVGIETQMEKDLPGNIICIHKTESQKELAEIYSAADIFLNPTREENYPTVNLEAVACGTPVITFDVGGCKETITDKTGVAVPINDIEELKNQIMRISTDNPFKPEDFEENAKSLSDSKRFLEYIKLYKN